ncbi:hypothetical protein LCGC14_0586200 [marine sediment metagenome]|uniref:SprT-like domain-containing protein n=1 Tax=marine sediment metagenome TaxID=412755 RepID=A0A0F9RJT6_9ZZZZ
MIPTEAWILERLEYYHDMMEISMPLSVFFHEKDWLGQSFAQTDTHREKIACGDILGLNRMEGLAMLINLDQPKEFISKDVLENTIIHETIHSKYPDLGHGGTFNYYVREVRAGIFPPRKRNILVEFKDWLIA